MIAQSVRELPSEQPSIPEVDVCRSKGARQLQSSEATGKREGFSSVWCGDDAFAICSGGMSAFDPSSDFERKVARLALVPRVMWACMLASLGVLTFVASSIAAGTRTHVYSGPSLEQLQAPFAGAAIVIGLVVLLVRSKLLNSGATVEPAASTRTRTVERDLTQDQQAQLSRVVKKFPVFVTCLALAEAIGILGFVLAIASKSVEPMLPFVAGAAVLFVLLFPQPRKW